MKVQSEGHNRQAQQDNVTGKGEEERGTNN